MVMVMVMVIIIILIVIVIIVSSGIVVVVVIVEVILNLFQFMYSTSYGALAWQSYTETTPMLTSMPVGANRCSINAVLFLFLFFIIKALLTF